MNQLGALAALLVVAAATPAPLVVREQAWTAPSENSAHDLTHAPAECAASSTPESEIGRALFRSPGLLGGPAARLGLSCNACHTNGRANARFFLPELTNRAGAADVTSEWASHVRGDGVLNPVDIPDLAGAASRPAFGQHRDPSLEHFVGSVIVDEFQGAQPPSQAFAGVIAYIRTLDSDSCPPGEIAITLGAAANDVRRALSAAEAADQQTASLLLLAAQDGVGRIVERLPRRAFMRDRSHLEALARELGDMRNQPFEIAAETSLPGWRARFDGAVSRIARRERRTYFSEARLREALKTL